MGMKMAVQEKVFLEFVRRNNGRRKWETKTKREKACKGWNFWCVFLVQSIINERTEDESNEKSYPPQSFDDCCNLYISDDFLSVDKLRASEEEKQQCDSLHGSRVVRLRKPKHAAMKPWVIQCKALEY